MAMFSHQPQVAFHVAFTAAINQPVSPTLLCSRGHKLLPCRAHQVLISILRSDLFTQSFSRVSASCWVLIW